MMLMTEAPADLYDEFVVGPGGTHVGETLARMNASPPGAWLAVLVESVEVDALTAEDLVELLRTTARLTAWVAAVQVRAVAQLARLRGPSAPAEVGFALREPAGAAQRRIHYATTLVRRLPATLAALARGQVLPAHAEKLADATSGVDDPDVLAEVQRRVLERAGNKTARELGRHARDLVARLDPAGAQRRNREARDQADVTLYPDEEGMSDVNIHAPVEDGVLVKTAVDTHAAAAKSAGDPRPIGVLRAAAIAGWAADYLSGRCKCADSAAAPRSGGRPVEISVTVGLRTALGRDELPGEIPGQGIVPREVIARMIAAEQAKLRLMVIDEATGRLLYRATDAYRPTAEQVAHVRAAYVHSAGPGSAVLAGRCDTDHVVPHPEGDTVIGNLIPLDRTWHRAKTLHGVHVALADDGTVTITTPLGQTRTIAPHDYRMSDPTSPTEHTRTAGDTTDADPADTGHQPTAAEEQPPF